MRVPALLIVLPLLAGAVAGLLTSDGLNDPLARAAAAGAAMALVAAISAVAIGSIWESAAGLVAGCALAGMSLGATAARSAYHPPLSRWFEARAPAQWSEPIMLDGILREDAATIGATPSLILDVTIVRTGTRARDAESSRSDDGWIPAPGGARLSVAGAFGPSRTHAWRAGRRLRVTALLRLPSVYLNPGVRDERRALARRGIVLVGTIKSAALVEVVNRGSLLAETTALVRAWTRARLGAAIGRWSPRSAAVATAILIGDRTGLSLADTRRLQDAGTYHVIAISGGNIAILTLLMLWLFGVFRASIRVAAWVAMPLLIGYGAVVVQSASVQRAVIVAVVYLSARGLDRQGSALNVLAVAAALGIAASPVVLFDPGFLLSFGATLGILAAAALQKDVGAGDRALLARLAVAAWTLLWTTIAAEAALLPITAVIFGRVTFAGLILNFAAIPLMSVLQALSLLVLITSSVSAQMASLLGYLAHLAAAGIVESAQLTDHLQWLARDVAVPALWLVVSYYAAVVTAVLVGQGRARNVAVAVGVVALGGVVAGPSWVADAMAPPPAGVRVVFLDVGQGDSSAIVFPDGRAILVDAGGIATAQSAEPAEEAAVGFDVGARVVAPALRALGVRRLAAFAMTHGDPDHIGGALAVLRSFHPPSVWEGVPVPPHPWLRGVSDAADALGLHWRTAQAGDVERIGPVTIRVLHPPLPDWERQRVRNEDSIVLEVRVGDVSIILPGDIGAEGERAILPLLRPARIVVFKAPHHGSATSSTPALLAALRPAAVVFSAGRNNRFGHPAAKVVARYREMDVAMFSTAEDGAVLLDTDGRDVTLRGWTGRTMTLRGSLNRAP